MKTMKKILSGLAVLLLISLFGFNQEVKAQDINTLATLVQEIVVTAGEPLSFGNIVNRINESKTVNADGSVDGEDFGGTTSRGDFLIEKAPNIPVSLTFVATNLFLSGPDSDEIEFDFEGNQFGLLSASGVTSVPFDPSTPTIISGTSNDAFFPVTQFQVFLGGTVTVADDDLDEGDYSGTITLTAAYN